MKSASPSRRDVLALLGAAAAAVASAGREALGVGATPTEQKFFAAYRDKATLGFGLGALAEETGGSWTRLVEGRMHGGQVRPGTAELAVVARRPGSLFIVVDARDGSLLRAVPAQAGRYYLGHGVFSADGARLFISEASAETARGAVGVYDATRGYIRIAEWATGGSDPHELVLARDGRSLWVANGGIELHPETGRAIINEGPTSSSLVRLGLDGAVLDQLTLDKELSSLSIRHMAATAGGDVVFGCQDQGDVSAALPLLGRASAAGRCEILGDEVASWRGMNGYVGSVAIDAGGTIIAATSPRGGRVWFQSLSDPAQVSTLEAADVCGAAALDEPARFILTTGLGKVLHVDVTATGPVVTREYAAAVNWDNHIIRG